MGSVFEYGHEIHLFPVLFVHLVFGGGRVEPSVDMCLAVIERTGGAWKKGKEEWPYGHPLQSRTGARRQVTVPRPV